MSEIISDSLFKIVRISTSTRVDGGTSGSMNGTSTVAFKADFSTSIPTGFKLAAISSVINNHTNSCAIMQFNISGSIVYCTVRNLSSSKITNMTITIDALLIASATDDPTGYVDIDATPDEIEKAASVANNLSSYIKAGNGIRITPEEDGSLTIST